MREWQSSQADGDTAWVIGRLLGQVKKSEKPSIVFIDRHLGGCFNDKREITFQSPDVPSRRHITDVLRQHALVTRKGWIGSGIREAFKKPTDLSKWYSAFVTACKAAESAFDAVAARPGPIEFQLIKPL